MPDIMAIVSKAVFEREARVGGKTVGVGDVWPIDRYNSNAKALAPLEDGGRIFLVTVRPPNEELWFLGVIDGPESDGSAWISEKANGLPVTNITPLRKTIAFESGKGMSQDKGTLGMSLQSPRPLTSTDVQQILDVVGGKAPPVVKFAQTAISPSPLSKTKTRIIGGKYEVQRQLGQGGMGAVYEAKHTGTGRRVAIKEIVSDELRKDKQVVERLQREARATGAIESQHIAAILDSGEDTDTKCPFLVMELLQGEDLQQLMVRNGPLPQDVALAVVAQACIGLCRAHDAGVIHRDIKPANLFLARRERAARNDGSEEVIVKLLDFGIARMREEMGTGQSRQLTSTGLMLGTPLYMSPEQVMGPKNVDHRSDVWSLGVVLYEALTGATPHADVETMGALLVAICSKPAKAIADVAPHVRRSVAAIVKKSLEIDVSARYQSAEELLTALTKELSVGMTLTDEMLGLRPASVRADSEARSAFELAKTAPLEHQGTMRSATPIPGIGLRPGGDRKG